MRKPLISIITVCYNSESTIRDTLHSVASQSYKNYQHIIVDGCSTDGTMQIVKDWDKHDVLIISEPDKGLYDAMNKGLDMADGDVIGFLNSDDMYFYGQVLAEVATAFADSQIEACHSDLVYVGQRNLHKVVRYWKSCEYQVGLFQKGWMPAHPTFFARKSIYEKYGCFDLDYKLAADFEIMMRLIGKHNINTFYIPKVFVKMRLGGATNKSVTNIMKQNIEIIRAYKKNGIKFSFSSFVVNKMISRLMQFYNFDNN